MLCRIQYLDNSIFTLLIFHFNKHLIPVLVGWSVLSGQTVDLGWASVVIRAALTKACGSGPIIAKVEPWKPGVNTAGIWENGRCLCLTLVIQKVLYLLGVGGWQVPEAQRPLQQLRPEAQRPTFMRLVNLRSYSYKDVSHLEVVITDFPLCVFWGKSRT